MINKFEDIRELGFNSTPKKIFDTPKLDVLKTLHFNQSTKFTDATLPNTVLEYGKIPPLGIKAIHKSGITGKGVNVAIIDQPLALDHPEYKGKIVEYKTFFPNGSEIKPSSMHGPAVTSLLVGENIGTAPDARVFYAAVPSWLGDAQYEAQALKWIMETNESLEEDKKIKFVSVSAAPGNSDIRPKNSCLWNKTVKEAEEKGLCVIDCTEGHRFLTVGYIDYGTNEFHYGFPNRKMARPQFGEIHVPNSLRTVAESYDNKTFSYAYNGVGGLSWGIPYAVGILALGQQLNCNISANSLKNLLLKTSAENNCIISPKAFLDMIKNKSFAIEQIK